MCIDGSLDSGGDGGVVLIAASLVSRIVEGGDQVVDDILQQSGDSSLVLLKSALCEGLRRADRAAAAGLHALGRLLANVSELRNWSDVGDDHYGDKPSATITADALLSALVGVIGERDDLRPVEQLWNKGLVPKTTDAAMVAALLSTRERDTFYLETFASLVMMTLVERDDASVQERTEWSVSDELASRLRAKAQHAGDGGSA